jgi:hypothetical protein
MKPLCAFFALVLLMWASGSVVAAQSPQVTAPTLVRLDGRLTTPNGEPRAGTVAVVVSLYADKDDPTPLWIEHQAITLDSSGRYTIFAGATQPEGLPREHFLSNSAHWLGIAVQGEPEQPRVMLVTMPYALKAAEADTLGGKTATDFVLNERFAESVKSALKKASMSSVVVTGVDAAGTGPGINALNFLLKDNGSGGSTASTIAFDSGTNLGVGTSGPTTKLDVNGVIGLLDGGAKVRNGGISSQGNGLVFDFGVNVDSNNYFGGAYTPADQGGMLVFDTRAGQNLFRFVGRPAGSTGQASEIFSVTSSGTIGVGTITPAAKLHVVGASTGASGYASILTDSNPTNGFVQVFGYTPAGPGLKYSALAVDSGGLYFGKLPDALNAPPTLQFAVLKSGNVGVGTTTPSNIQSSTPVLHVFGAGPALRIQDTTSGGDWNLFARNGATNQFRIYDNAGGADRLVISSSGNVGIGTTAPTAKLDVNGNVNVSGNIGAKYQDVAEWVETSAPLEAGTVVIVDPQEPNRVTPAARAYDTRVAGAVSRQPGLVLGEPGDSKVLVAQSGRVRIKADAKYGAIKIGDLLVTSPTPGYAMMSRGIKVGGRTMHQPGTLLGKALEPLPNGKGEILVLLTLQ